MITHKEWAENEVKLYKKRSTGKWGDYVNECADSALKALNSLLEDGHSGLSIGVTKALLDNLIDGRPITPITEDENDIWYFCSINEDDAEVYQCERMFSLFKQVYKDGSITYKDVDRVVCVNEEGLSYTSGPVSKIINDIYPLTLPYEGERFKVKVDDNGDYIDIVSVTHNGEPIPSNERTYIYGTWDISERVPKRITSQEFLRLKEGIDSD